MSKTPPDLPSCHLPGTITDMQFGKGIFQLTEESYKLETSFTNSHPKELHLGLPVWKHAGWKENFYTKDCPEVSFLTQYSERLDCVEVSSTFYSPQPDRTLQKWKESVSENFHFLPKWPKQITHDFMLNYCKQEIKFFCDSMFQLDEKLGTTILQLPPKFTQDYSRALYYFLQEVPKDFPICIEFRHESWFEKNRLYSKLEDYLYKEEIGIASSDTPGARNVFNQSFTGKKNIVRYLSDTKKEHDQERLNTWKTWLESNEDIGELYFILHFPDNQFAPELIQHISPDRALKLEQLRQDAQYSLF